MGTFEGLLYGLSIALSGENLLAALAGALAGTAIGVLPGLGPVAGVAMVLPLTYALGPTAGLIMMAGIYYGAMYGGSTTAVLINMPGESASVMTCVDGYQLTKKGRAGAVLTIVAVGSFVGGTLSVIGVTLFAPPLAEFAILFGPAEFFALTAGGLLLFSRISGGSFAAGIFPMALGLVLSTVGQEAVTGQNRFTFGDGDLVMGIELVGLVVGLYGLAEIMSVVDSLRAQNKPITVGLRNMLPTKEEWRRSVAPYFRGTGLGFFFGLLPGPSATLSSFASYRLEKAVARNREQMGQGAIEGVAGPETANNAAATSTMVPLLALGIPFGSVAALMLAGMMVHGVQPGPMMMSQHPEVFWGVIASMVIGNVMLLILNIPFIAVWVSLLRIPNHIFLPIILVMATVGSYSVRNSMFDVYVLLAVGILGYILRKLDFQLAPMVVGLVLGPLIEKHLREGLFMNFGEVSVFYGSSLALGIWAIVLFILFLGPLLRLCRRLFDFKAKALVLENNE
ncbi:MAG: tripartite tricarboxylate transporter permease [Noviherbaspirillum sp.]